MEQPPTQQTETKVKKSNLYTKTGDAGTSSLFNSERRSKDDQVFEALGTVDETISALGVAREYVILNPELNHLAEQIEEIQSRLFDIAGCVATPKSKSTKEQLERTAFDPNNLQQLEKWVDGLDSQLPTLKNFILPSGGLASTHLHLARTICRRAERTVVPLVREDEVEKHVAAYLNRLSDFLFAAARFSALKDQKEEKLYKKGKGVTVRELK
eukprot:TRINITY_DN80_c0_g1_i1.p1 TRINITY_DN80_c0_g1~~TRINITY_DN80_c0_g1_i1.p1  ORF type:complete len:228 (-),score=65.19 TRINITY_DN80_c0_g1_i1:176-814(-)